MKLAKDVGVKCLWLKGDFNSIIKFLRGDHLLAWTIKNITNETKINYLSFDKVFMSYVYYKGNVAIEWMANEAVRRKTSQRWAS